MTEMTSEIINAIKGGSTVLVCGHIRPDGDCIGSCLAVRRICEKLGKRADAVCDDEFPSYLNFLPDFELLGKTRFEYYDLFIAVDCANDKRLGKYKQNLLDAGNSIVIDHHPTNDGYGKINCIRPEACSTCQIIHELFKNENLIDKDIASMLYTGVSTDTGHFMHANTNANVFSTAVELCGYGLDVGALNHDIYCNKTPERIKLTSLALNGITLHRDGKIAVMSVSLKDLKTSGCKADDTEGLIDFAKGIAGVRIAVAMCEQQGGMYRISLRSVTENVAAVAEKFGGGGHRLAAGCIVSGTLRDVKKKIIDAAAEALTDERAD